MRLLSALLLVACAAALAEAAPARRAGAPALATAHGARLLGTAFRTKEGGVGEVVVQTSAEVELESHDDDRTAPVFVLKHCRILRANDRRPLDTRFFASPVTGVRVKGRGGDVHVSVSLRVPTTAVLRKEHGPGNSWYWILSFTSGAAARQPPRTGRAASPANP